MSGFFFTVRFLSRLRRRAKRDEKSVERHLGMVDFIDSIFPSFVENVRHARRGGREFYKDCITRRVTICTNRRRI